MRDPKEVLQALCARILPPPPVLSLSEWADTKRVLGPEESSEPGRWRTDRAPYLREIMDAISNPDIRTVVVQASARVGKTELINNSVGYYIDQAPTTMLVVLPTVDLGKSWSKEKLTPMLRNTPALRGKVGEAKARESSNTVQMKVFQGGYVAIAGANSPNGLSSRTVQVVYLDEVDKIAASAMGFGSPIELAKKRTTTFPGRWKHVLTSTPGIKEESVIEAEYQAGDQCRYYLTCPHCGVADYLRWAQVQWPDNKPEEACYHCPSCQGTWGDADKPKLLAEGKWVSSKKAAVPGTRSFHIWEAYSPWVTFSAMAISFLQKKKQGRQALQTFVNESLGETWDDNRDQETKVTGLLARARLSKYRIGEIPAQVAMLVAAVDVQDDRLEVLVRGVAPGGTRYTIEHLVLAGNPALKNLWNTLEKHLTKVWERLDSGQMKIRKITIDTGGHFEKQVNDFCRRRSMIGLAHPIKGSSRPMKTWVAPSKKRSKLMFVDTTAVKRHIYNTLKIDDPTIDGYQWFPVDTDQTYFDQLMSEHIVKTANTWRYEPIKKGMRNEIIDLHTYCEAALALFKPKSGELEDMVEFYASSKSKKPLQPTITEEEFTEVEPEAVPEEPIQPPRKRQAPPRVRPVRLPIVKRGPIGF